ncbi:hypothetical protein C8Q70DRAFT_1052293 [Cubamyces menziesii]|uniref:RING-type domain-containing protein n=1 Tax=Trametes cubensis TaxID=1111947 RepID=A0AAD7TP26_9APHY|nr:hypothetical protein C8Q70DRAFT_1052293 [Cubamyces menziesii]KAJ8472904.1 hypothetical protein ONZ51_g8194 [Trametes cubensis]
MPPTRSEPRQGSSRPVAQSRHGSVLDVRPVGGAITLSSDDESPPRKKAAVEKKTVRQRSKQKARVPLPPTTEVIEISSDDEVPVPKRPSGSMTALERRIKELEEENKKWKEAAMAAQAALAFQTKPQPQLEEPHKQPTPPADTRFDKFLSTVDEHVTCEICTMKMWQPYTLSCGHTFCRDCLQDWFNTALVQHMTTHPQYNPQTVVPPHWRAALARPDLSHIARRQIEREIDMIMEATPQPAYSCPTCRLEIRNKPAENFVVKHIVRTVAGVQGESCPKEDPPPRIGRPLDGPWDGFFPAVRKF